eukprot:3438261-Prymnesium_polylepis.2
MRWRGHSARSCLWGLLQVGDATSAASSQGSLGRCVRRLRRFAASPHGAGSAHRGVAQLVEQVDRLAGPH